MKIAILADIHGNEPYLEKAKQIIKTEKAKRVIVCGDIESDETFRELDTWKEKIYLALGNADYSIREKLDLGVLYPEKMEIVLDFGVINVDDIKIAYCHNNVLAQRLAGEGKYDFVFYGHTHTPWEQQIGKTMLINPGEVSARYGKPTMALFDTKTRKTKLILI